MSDPAVAQAPEPKMVVAPTADLGAPPGEGHETFEKMLEVMNQSRQEWDQSRFGQKPAESSPPPEPPKEPEAPKPPEPAKPKEEPKAEPAPEPPKEPAPPKDDGVPPILKGKAADEFRNLKAKTKQMLEAKEHELLGLRKQLESSKAPDPAPQLAEMTKQIESLRAEREQLIAQVEKASLESSPRFQQKYAPAMAQLESEAKMAAGDANADVVLGLLKMPPSKARRDALNKIMSDLEPVDQTTLGYAFTQMDSLRVMRDSELANARGALQQEQAAAAAEAARQEQLTLAKRQYLVTEIQEAAKKNFEAFQPIEGDEAHNREIAVYNQEISEFIEGKVDETYAAYLPVLAAEGQYLKSKKVPRLEAKIAELEKQIGELTGAAPKPGTGRTTETPVEEKPTGFVDAFLKQWPGPNAR